MDAYATRAKDAQPPKSSGKKLVSATGSVAAVAAQYEKPTQKAAARVLACPQTIAISMSNTGEPEGCSAINPIVYAKKQSTTSCPFSTARNRLFDTGYRPSKNEDLLSIEPMLKTDHTNTKPMPNILLSVNNAAMAWAFALPSANQRLAARSIAILLLDVAS